MASLVSSGRTIVVSRSNSLVLLSAFFVYVYRDVWPLATYTEVPIDASEGRIIWMKLIAVSVTAVLIPLFVPTKYVPVDPKVSTSFFSFSLNNFQMSTLQDPMPVPNPEQTTSLFSFMIYSFMDPIIFLGARTDHLSPNQLPPLCDTDASQHLVENAFPVCVPFPV